MVFGRFSLWYLADFHYGIWLFLQDKFCFLRIIITLARVRTKDKMLQFICQCHYLYYISEIQMFINIYIVTDKSELVLFL